MTSRWFPKPVLDAEQVTLRPFEEADTVAMAAILADPEVLRMTGSATSSEQAARGAEHSEEELRAWYGSRSQTDERLDLAVVPRSTGRVVGEVVLNRFDADANAANFRILLGPEARGQGIGTEAARLILRHGFEAIGLHRISLEVFDSNPQARRMYEKVGFVLEGIKRDAFRFDGQYIDDLLMAILADEWAEHRGHPAAGGSAQAR